MYTMFFWFTCTLVCDGVSPACGIFADKSVGAFYELAGFAPSASAGPRGHCLQGWVGLVFLPLLKLGDLVGWVVSCRLLGMGLVWLF